MSWRAHATMAAFAARAQALFANSAVARHGAAVLLVAATLGLRAALDSVLTTGVFFHLFYPAVIIAAYVLGVWPGLTAMALSALGGFALFGGPAPNALPLATFLISSALAVFLLAHVRGRLHFLQGEYERIDALTRSQASLFREHAGRVSDHLQLISALLQLHSREENRPAMSRALMDSAGRTLLISRMHRTFVAGDCDSIDFKAFAVRLVEAVLLARDHPGPAVVVEGERLQMPLERASALGLVLIECMNARAALGGRGVQRVVIESRGQQAVFRVVDEGVERAPARDMAFLGAVAAQMQASIVAVEDAGEASLQLSFAKDLPPLPQWRAPLQPVR